MFRRGSVDTNCNQILLQNQQLVVNYDDVRLTSRSGDNYKNQPKRKYFRTLAYVSSSIKFSCLNSIY